MEFSKHQDKEALLTLGDEWELVPFQELLDSYSGGKHKIKKGDYLESGQHPIIDQGEEFIGGYTNDSEVLIDGPFPKIIFGDHTRRFKYVDFRFGVGADGTKILTPKRECNVKYLYYYFKSISLPDTGYNRHFKYLKRVIIPLPPLETQKKIAAVLDKADALRQKRRQTIDNLDELTRSLYLDMFGDPDKNPKELEEVELGELTDIQGGYAFKSKNFIDNENAVKVVKIANVHYKDVDWSEVQYLPIGKLEEHDKYSLSEKNILLALTRPIINSLDAVKAVVVQKSDLPALLNQRVARIRVDSDRVTQGYISSFIYTQYFKRQIEKYASTSLQPNVSIKEVNKIQVLVPPIEEQERFMAIRRKIIQQSSRLEKSVLYLNELFNALLQKAFKGELNFSDGEEPLLAAEETAEYSA